jgi:hypothetical protein
LQKQALGVAATCLTDKGYAEAEMAEPQRRILAALGKEERQKAYAILAGGGDVSSLRAQKSPGWRMYSHVRRSVMAGPVQISANIGEVPWVV